MIKRFIRRIVKEVLKEVSETPLDDTGKIVILDDSIATIRGKTDKEIGEMVTRIIKEQRAVKRIVLDIQKLVLIW